MKEEEGGREGGRVGGKKEGGRARDKRDGRKGRGKGEGGREKREGGRERVQERGWKREEEEAGRGRESVNVGARQCLGNRVTIALHSRLHVLPHTFSLHMYTHTHTCFPPTTSDLNVQFLNCCFCCCNREPLPVTTYNTVSHHKH